MSRRGPTRGPWRAQAGIVVSDTAVPRMVALTYSPASLARWPEDAAERDANARMIAAAPDMAEELRHVAALARTAILHQRDLDKTGLIELVEQIREAAEAALAKAEP
jgi:hypothetical protein